MAANSKPVISMSVEACDDLLRDHKYLNYHRSVNVGVRPAASEMNHGDKLMVTERIYPQFARYLHYGVLSPDGRGLPNYGSVAVRWRPTPFYLETRATLLEENEFAFFERHGLGVIGSPVPAGYRAIWANRAQLAVVKLAPQLSSAVAKDEIAGLLLRDGPDRSTDEFIEVVMYSEQGIDAQDIESIRLLRPLTDDAQKRRWDIVLATCKQREIGVY